MNIFVMTSVPLNPPWDQGDKNLAYTLTQVLSEHQFQGLGMRSGLPPEGENLHLLPLYRSRNPTILQKARVYWHLLARSFSNGLARMANGRPDLYHLIYQPTPLSSRLNRLLPEFKNRPILHTLPAVTSINEQSANLFFADRLVAISKHAHQVLNNLGFENVTYIPPGINFHLWAGLPWQRDLIKSRLGLADRPVVLYPGHYTPGYGMDVILRALPAVVAQNPGVQILFACRSRSKNDREREIAIRRHVARLGLDQNVRYFNTVTDMRVLIGASDLTVLPLETMQDKVDIPITLLESMAAGVPIIISDLAPMNELLNSLEDGFGIPGLSIPCGDAGALTSTITHLLEDIGFRNQLAINGQALVRKRYDACCQMAHQYNKIYNQLSR